MILNSSPSGASIKGSQIIQQGSPINQSTKVVPISSRNEAVESGLNNHRRKEASLDSIVNTGGPIQDNRVQIIKPDM